MEILILKTNQNRGLPTAVSSRTEQTRVRQPLGFGTVSSDSTATAPRGSPARSTDRQTHTRADLALKLHRWESRNRHSSSSCYVKRPQAPPSTRQTVLQTSPSPCAVAAKRVGCCSYKSQCLHLQKKVIFLIVHRMSICKYQEY